MRYNTNNWTVGFHTVVQFVDWKIEQTLHFFVSLDEPVAVFEHENSKICSKIRLNNEKKTTINGCWKYPFENVKRKKQITQHKFVFFFFQTRSSFD